MRSIVLVALSTLGVAVAQSSSGNFTINPASVEPRTRGTDIPVDVDDD